MARQKNNFTVVRIKSPKHLDSVATLSIQDKDTAYYLITNSWDPVCNYFNDRLPTDGTTDLNVIDIFNVPNALDVIKTSIKAHKNTISTSCLSQYEQLPMLVVVHKSFPRVVSYNGSVGAEIGV